MNLMVLQSLRRPNQNPKGVVCKTESYDTRLSNIRMSGPVLNKQTDVRKQQAERKQCVKEIAVSCYSPPGIRVGRSVSSLVQRAEEVRWSRSVSASPWVCVEQSEDPLRKRKK